VALAGLVVLLAESFREGRERMPLGGLAIIGLAGAAVASVLLWDRNATSFGVVTADNFALFVNLVILVVGILTVSSRRTRSNATACRPGSTTRCCCSRSSA
jgi:NADH:ubiquinone oxidoreductase subunit 2 (subunit N)